MTQTVYGTKVTPYLVGRIATFMAQVPRPDPDIDFTGGLLVVGDGNGAVPTVDEIIGNGGVLNEVWRGATIGGVEIDVNNPNQVNILCVIPTGVGGTEIGPFTVREFAIYVQDGEALQLALVGTTTLEKTTSAQGQTSDLIWIAAIGVSSAQPIIQTDPSAYFATIVDVRNAINANRLTAEAPFLLDETTTPTGWIRQKGKVRPASQPANAAETVDANNTGYGRPATNNEFAAGGSLGGFAWPWPTIAQVKSMIPAIPARPGALAPISYNADQNRYEGLIATADQVRGGTNNDRIVTAKALADSADFLAVADAATIVLPMGEAYNFRVAIGANRTIGVPTGMQRGRTYIVNIKKTAANLVYAWNACFNFGPNGAPAQSTAANATDKYALQCESVDPPLFTVTLVQRGLTGL